MVRSFYCSLSRLRRVDERSDLSIRLWSDLFKCNGSGRSNPATCCIVSSSANTRDCSRGQEGSSARIYLWDARTKVQMEEIKEWGLENEIAKPDRGDSHQRFESLLWSCCYVSCRQARAMLSLVSIFAIRDCGYFGVLRVINGHWKLTSARRSLPFVRFQTIETLGDRASSQSKSSIRLQCVSEIKKPPGFGGSVLGHTLRP